MEIEPQYNIVISVSKKGNYGYFCCVHDSLEDLFYFVLHHAEKIPMVDSQCSFLSGWTKGHKGRDFKHSLLIYPQKEK